MTETGFTRSMPRVLAHEGGYVNDPFDPGGATNKGITERVYDAWRARKGFPKKDVRDITNDEIYAIYRAQYWRAVHGDELPAGLDYVLFDGAVNSGPGMSIRWLQRAVGVEPDGQIGVITLAAVDAYKGTVAQLIDDVCDRRMAFLKALLTWPRFGKGWSARVAGVRTIGKAWANKEPVSVAPAEPTPKAKAPAEAESWSWLDALYRLSPFRKAS